MEVVARNSSRSQGKFLPVVLSARPLLQPYTGDRCQDPANSNEWLFGYERPHRGIDKTQHYGEDANENISHVWKSGFYRCRRRSVSCDLTKRDNWLPAAGAKPRSRGVRVARCVRALLQHTRKPRSVASLRTCRICQCQEVTTAARTQTGNSSERDVLSHL